MEISQREALIELARRRAKVDVLAFIQWCWQRSSPLQIGKHTRAIADRLTKACEDWEQGKSTYLLVNVPFRHGKSDLISRYFPAFFLGRMAQHQPDIIMSGYGASLVEGFSKMCKGVIRSPEYQDLFPEVQIDRGRDAVDSWGIKGSSGTITVVGLGGSITGKGGNLIVLDDYCKNREEAYSEVYREKTWNSFSVDLMTRQNAPACIVVVCATPWHTDDITGRIKYQMQKDPEFPRFEELVFPARCEQWDYLFSEMYDAQWYDNQRATLGPAAASALLDCNPVGDGNKYFREHWFQTLINMPEPSAMNIYILIDSANSKRKESDYTVMTVWGLGRDNNYYLLDAIRDRLDLSGRTDAIFNLVERWQPKCVFWEQIGAMSDVQHVRSIMDARAYHFPIIELHQSVPKIDRIGWLVPLFEARKIYFPVRMLREADDGSSYDFVQTFLTDEYATFPACRHDDMLDCVANLKHPTFVSNAGFPAHPSSVIKEATHTTARDWRPF